MVSISYPATLQVQTVKSLSVSVANYLAAVTGFRSVGRVNQEDFNTSNSSFIFGKHFELVKRPIVMRSILRFTDFSSLSNPTQVFKCDCCFGLFSFLDKLFADVVIDVTLKPRFSPREPFQEAFRPFRAFSLNRSSNSNKLSAGFLELFSLPGLTPKSWVSSPFL